jgi:trk system potassium uptake protein
MEERLNIFGNKRLSLKRLRGVVTAETKIEKDDILLLFGHVKDIQAILNLDI